MADTSKDGLLFGGGIHHITTTSVFTRGSELFPACVRNIVETRLFSAIFRLFARHNIKLLQTYYCQVEVKVRDRIAVVISEIIGRSGRHFLSKQSGGGGLPNELRIGNAGIAINGLCKLALLTTDGIEYQTV